MLLAVAVVTVVVAMVLLVAAAVVTVLVVTLVAAVAVQHPAQEGACPAGREEVVGGGWVVAWVVGGDGRWHGWWHGHGRSRRGRGWTTEAVGLEGADAAGEQGSAEGPYSEDAGGWVPGEEPQWVWEEGLTVNGSGWGWYTKVNASKEQQRDRILRMLADGSQEKSRVAAVGMGREGKKGMERLMQQARTQQQKDQILKMLLAGRLQETSRSGHGKRG
ncbi:hypothetical protein CLOM_g4810 [Closterium sp. NIES-68]|nr:hypothetical protein CLOM_g4810 [Closterium sp. NIES-68]